MLFIKRNIETLVKETIKDTPVTVIQGARQVGKSTLATMISGEMSCLSITLDDGNTLAAARGNPYEFVSLYREGLMIIDEVQRFPELLSAIKLSVDRDRRPGRFLITGSANILHLSGANESLAGRAETVVLEPFSVGEVMGIKEDFVSLLSGDSVLRNLQRSKPLSRIEYANMIERGGYPDAQNRDYKRRKAYFKNYISRVLDHDADELSGLSHLDRLIKIHSLLAAKPSQIYIRANVSRSTGIPESSLNGYIRLLEDLCMIHTLPAWGKSFTKRAISKPKIVMVDSGLVCSLCGVTGAFLADIENGNELGPLLEAFVISEINKQKSWSEIDFSLHHYRDCDNKEVDLVLELEGGNIIAIEIKASSSFSQKDFIGLKALREMLGKRFQCGIVLYTGSEAYPFGDRLFAAPISSIWQEV